MAFFYPTSRNGKVEFPWGKFGNVKEHYMLVHLLGQDPVTKSEEKKVMKEDGSCRSAGVLFV